MVELPNIFHSDDLLAQYYRVALERIGGDRLWPFGTPASLAKSALDQRLVYGASETDGEQTQKFARQITKARHDPVSRSLPAQYYRLALRRIELGQLFPYDQPRYLALAALRGALKMGVNDKPIPDGMMSAVRYAIDRSYVDAEPEPSTEATEAEHVSFAGHPTHARIELRSHPHESPVTVISGIVAARHPDESGIKIENIYVGEDGQNSDVTIPYALFDEFHDAMEYIYYKIFDAALRERHEREQGSDSD